VDDLGVYEAVEPASTSEVLQVKENLEISNRQYEEGEVHIKR
jgi:hypothetical protein